VYLQQARNADQHTIQPTTVDSLGGVAMTIPQGQSIQIVVDKKKDVLGLWELQAQFDHSAQATSCFRFGTVVSHSTHPKSTLASSWRITLRSAWR